MQTVICYLQLSWSAPRARHADVPLKMGWSDTPGSGSPLIPKSEWKQPLARRQLQNKAARRAARKITDEAARERTIAIQDLAERVREETGHTLTDGWTVSIERSLLKGKDGQNGKTKRRTRYYSPGGRRFSSMPEAITELRKQQVGSENLVRRSSFRDAKPVDRLTPNFVPQYAWKAASQKRVAEELDTLRARCAEHRELADVDIGDGWNVEWRVRSEGSKDKNKYRKSFVAPDGARRFHSVPEVVEYLKKLVAADEVEEEDPGTVELMTASEVRRVETKHKRKTVAGREKGMLKKLKAVESNLVGSLNAAPPNGRVSALERALDELRGEVRELRGKVAEQTSELAELRADAACDELRGIVAAQARELADLRRAPSTVWRPHVRVDHIPA